MIQHEKKNDDGKFSRDEILASPPQDLDTNPDGMVDLEEIKALLQTPRRPKENP